eukprot:Skav214925  [mRNA]  locus=scaffold2073:231216:246341:- [translate_table: standard]
MEGKVTMERPDHGPDLSKLKKKASGLQPWAVGAASCGVVLLCAGAWCLWHQAQEEARILQSHSSWPKPKVSKTAFQPSSESSDTLEDALNRLEGDELERLRPRKDKPKAKASMKEKEETSEEDKDRAKDVIRDTLKKLEAEGCQHPWAHSFLIHQAHGQNGPKQIMLWLKLIHSDSQHALLPILPAFVAKIEKLKALLGEEEEEEEEITEEQQLGNSDLHPQSFVLASFVLAMSHLDFAKALQEEQKRKIHVDMKTVRQRNQQAVKPDDEEGSARFEASEVTGEGEREGKRLCAAILEESRFDILARLIQGKIPEMQQLGGEKHHPNWERWLCAERMRLCLDAQSILETAEHCNAMG